MDLDHDKMQSVGAIGASIVSGLQSETRFSGGPISKPGIYSEVPIERYHGDTLLFNGDFSISSTGLRQVLARPAAYWCYSPFNPNRFEKSSNPAFEFGKAAHMLLLGEDGFAEKYSLRPEVFPDYRSGAAQKWRNDQIAAGKSIVTIDDIKAIKSIRDTLSSREIVRNGLMNGRIERSIFFKSDDIWIRARPDVIPNDGGDYVDLKTASDLDDESISKAIYNHGYHIQAGLIRMAVREILGPDAFASFTFVFVEKAPPYDVRIMQLKDDDIDLGEKLAVQAIKTVKRCLAEDKWPGYDGWDREASWIEMPTWAKTRIENELRAA